MANRIGRRSRQTLQILHYISSVGWLGVGFAQLTLNLVALLTGSPSLRHDAHEMTHIFDRTILTALSLAAATTGILLAVRTPWGLLRHWWIVVKLTLTVGLIITIPIWVGGWNLQAITATAGGSVDPGYPTVRAELLGSSITIVGTLIVITIISVVKPWGRIRSRSRSRSARAGDGVPRDRSAVVL